MEPVNQNATTLGEGGDAAAIGPPGGGSSPLPPDGGMEFSGESRVDDYDPGKDPELNSDFGDQEENVADFDFTDSGELDSKPATKEATKEASSEEESEEDLRAFVDSMDGILRSAGAAMASKQDAAESKPFEFKPVQLTREQLEEALDDPDKLNETLIEVQRHAIEAAREAFHAEAQNSKIQELSAIAQREADRMFTENKQLDTPEIRAKCAMVAQTLVAADPKLQDDIPTLMKYTARYMTARMRTHPHEFVVGKPGKLPPLPGARPIQGAGAPPQPGQPAFAGGGVSARRVRVEPRQMSEEEKELHSLKPDHAW